MGIENVIFDMGNVLLRFDGMLFSRIFTKDEDDARLLDEALFANPSWALLDAGVIDEDTMERIAQTRLPKHLHAALHSALTEWDLHQPPIPGTNELARRLHEAGRGIYLLSNAGLRFERACTRIPCWSLIDGWVVSAFERLMKPDPSIYLLLCDRYGLEPSSCLFVDDNEDNVIGARAAGLAAYLFDDAKGLEAELRRRGTVL